MGNREALLAGARRCLYEKGYARTTARDIAAASGVSLAAIGYHFGSKEALLNAALIEAIEEWGDEIARTLGDMPPDADPTERFAAIWNRVIASFTTHRGLWLVNFEVFAQSAHAPEVRRFLADAIEQGRLGLASLFEGMDEANPSHTAWAVGSFYQALLTGVSVQWLLDPERAPSGDDLADALRTIMTGINPNAGDDTTNRTASPPTTPLP